jgi:GNAT superfamily N-acetyltransferase
VARLVVRSIRRADRREWEALWQGYNDFYERAIPPRVTARTFARFFVAGGPVRALVAEDDTGLVGLVHYIFHPSTSLAGPTCYLQDLFTAAEARRHGVGRALITAVYDRASRHGAERVYWHTHESNARARRLYDAVAARTGFIVYATAIRPRRRAPV